LKQESQKQFTGKLIAKEVVFQMAETISGKGKREGGTFHSLNIIDLYSQ